MKIETIINKNSKKYTIWNNHLEEHFELNFSNLEYCLADKERIFYQTNELLFEIAKNFYSYGNFKDNWDNSKCHLNIFGQNLLLKSLKTNQTFDWGIENDNFYLQSYFYYPENIRHMKDDFWELILGLKNYGEFKFVENSGLNSKDRKKFENKTSNIFRIIRNYMLFQVETINSNDFQKTTYQDLGWLEIKWKAGTDWSELLENSCKAFKDLYRINYMLWKISDLKEKSTHSTS